MKIGNTEPSSLRWSFHYPLLSSTLSLTRGWLLVRRGCVVYYCCWYYDSQPSCVKPHSLLHSTPANRSTLSLGHSLLQKQGVNKAQVDRKQYDTVFFVLLSCFQPIHFKIPVLNTDYNFRQLEKATENCISLPCLHTFASSLTLQVATFLAI